MTPRSKSVHSPRKLEYDIPAECILPRGTCLTLRERLILEGRIRPLSFCKTLWLTDRVYIDSFGNRYDTYTDCICAIALNTNR